MSPVSHILVYTLLFTIFFVFCYKIKDIHETDFWKFALIPILAYAFIEGSRYGRGVDWIWYKYRYEHIVPFDEPQKAFLGLMQLLNLLHFDYVGAFTVYAVLLIGGTFYFIRNTFAKEGQWMFLFAIMAFTINAEGLIRQYVAQPFVFASIPLMLGRKWWQAGLVLLIGANIHTGVMMQIPLLVGSYLFAKKTLDWKIWAVLLFVVYYLLPEGKFVDNAISILQALHLDSILGVDSNLFHYIEDSDRWLGSESILEGSEQSIVTKTMQFLFEVSVIYVTSWSLKHKPNCLVLCIFNIVAVGFLTARIFHGYEIFTRLTQQLYIYWFVPAGYAFYVFFYFKRNTVNVKMTKYNGLVFTLCCLAVYQIMYWSRYVFLQPNALFSWTR